MDPMTEMFCDESNLILSGLRKTIVSRRGQNSYGQETVQEIFRSVHTLKADATMMLYENMAKVSKELEGLLYCFQGNGKEISDTERFTKIVIDYIDFFEEGIDKIIEERVPVNTADDLSERIQNYTQELTSQMEEEERQKYHLEVSKPNKQRFYIASAGTEEQQTKSSKSTGTDGAKEDSATSGNKNKKHYVISQEDRDKICQSVRSLLRLADSMEYALGEQESATFSREQYQKLRDVQQNLNSVKESLINTDFVPVAKKMEVVVDEMSVKLNKPAKLLVKGEKTPVDLEKREKISSALIHVIRNAMDHGIETMDERERLGKSPMGLIKLKFSTDNGRLKVSVTDDGAGMDQSRILEKAKQRGLLTKAPEEYTKNEIFDLVLTSGFTTSEEAGEYSGRGVGMDVVSSNVKSMGGKLKISSDAGIGTKITMKFN